MGESTCVWFRNDGGLDQDAVEAALRKAGLRVAREGETVVVEGPGVRFEVFLEELPGVDPAVGKGTRWHEEIQACNAEVYAVVPDLAAALDEANTLISVQLALQDLTRGFAHTTWNDTLRAPDGSEVNAS